MNSFKLYNLTCYDHNFISIKKPNIVPDSNYSLIEVSYNYDIITTIKGIYVGITNKTEHIFTNIYDILIGTDTTFNEKILSYIKCFDTDNKISIIKSYEIIDFFKNSMDEILYKLFIINLGSILFYYHLMSLDQNIIELPFDPINITFPFNDISVNVLDQNLYKHYIKYAGDILILTNTSNIGKLWMKQIMNFWDVWDSLFPQIMVFNDHAIMYESVLEYAKYINKEFSDLTECCDNAQDIIKDDCDKLRNESTEFMQTMKSCGENFKKHFRHASLLITIISSIVLKTIGTETKLSMKDYKNQSGIIMKEQLELLKNIVPELSNKIRSDIGKTINKNISKKIHQSILETNENLQYQIDELREEISYLKTNGTVSSHRKF